MLIARLGNTPGAKTGGQTFRKNIDEINKNLYLYLDVSFWIIEKHGDYQKKTGR